MAALEGRFRSTARVVRMDIHTTWARRKLTPGGPIDLDNRKTLWGVSDGDPQQTRLLYVFTGPGRLAGTTLLMHDRAGSAEQDAMWLYLRSFEIFKQLELETQRVMVPGTALTYEDSRGFIPLDKYRFSTVDSAGAIEGGGVSLLACPRSETIRKHVGYRSLLLRVDPEKQIVRWIQYRDLAGKPLKTYELLGELQRGERFYPAEVRLEHLAEGFTTRIAYEYWFPAAPPPALFEPSLERGLFVDRLEAYLAQIGQSERVRVELEQADEQFRQFEEKLRRIEAGK
ncbi:MAG: outer membrane lipoprotein-sorting protein [Deltaproteobacteria bacterium]|nr:outer membrane lipoprotein-sorting protein [Deltaproteobacteria bacterium]